MATNDFLPFAGGAGANTIDQPTYTALTARTAGFSSGVAQSAQLNKVWRQSSIMAAVIGQLIADITGQNATDDGTTATLLANLKAAILAQSNAAVGSGRNISAYLSAAASSVSITADQIVVSTSLSGQTYVLSSFNKSVNLATTGAGGMDTGSAPTSGYVALYAIYNPTTQTSALLAVNATSAVAPNVYGGANMPPGYTASALVAVWPTDGTGKLTIAKLNGRRLSISQKMAFTTSTAQSSLTPLSLASTVPPNAKRVGGIAICSCVNGTSNLGTTVCSDANNTGAQNAQVYSNSSTTSQVSGNYSVDIVTSQTIYYTFQNGLGTSPSLTVYVTGYEF